MRSSPTATPIRRALIAGVAAATATGVVPSSASAQIVYEEVVIDEFCAAVPASDDFDDITDGDAWAPAVRCLAHAGITGGVASGRYGEGEEVTREQMASFIARMMDVAVLRDADGNLTPLPAASGAPRFSDIGTESDYEIGATQHYMAIQRLAAAGIVQGGPGKRPADRFGPKLGVTREQMASFVVRSLEHLTGVMPQPTADHFDDDDGSTHERNIGILADVGIVVGYGDGTYRPEALVQRSSMASYITRSLALFHAEGQIDALPALPDAAVPLTVSSSNGVRIVEPDGSVAHVVATETYGEPAYAVGRDLVVHDSDGLVPDGAIVWSPDRVVALDVEAGKEHRVFDARLVDGVPTALVYEFPTDEGSDEPSQLVAVDLTDGSRTAFDVLGSRDLVLVSARLLADGDVVVTLTTVIDEGAPTPIERWSPGGDQPVWTAEIDRPEGETVYGFERGAVTVRGGTVFSVASTSGPAPTVAVTSYDAATGARGTTRTVVVPDFTAGPFEVVRCTDLLTDDVLACSRTLGRPIGVDLSTGWFQTLPGERGAVPAAVREGTAG